MALYYAGIAATGAAVVAIASRLRSNTAIGNITDTASSLYNSRRWVDFNAIPTIAGLVSSRTTYTIDKVRDVFKQPNLELNDILAINIKKTHEYAFKMKIKFINKETITEYFSPTLTTKTTEKNQLIRQFMEGTRKDNAMNLFSDDFTTKALIFKITVKKFIDIANTRVIFVPEASVRRSRSIIEPSSRQIGNIKIINKRSRQDTETSEHPSSTRRRLR